MSCTAKTTCETITAFVECLPQIYQGTDYDFEIQLFDELGEPLDLSEFSSIFMCLYTDGYDYLTYTWPDSTGNESINIIQSETTDGIIDMGIIGFNISADQSARFLTGSILAEIKFKKDSETTGGSPVYKTIGCLKLGNVKQSFTKNIKNF